MPLTLVSDYALIKTAMGTRRAAIAKVLPDTLQVMMVILSLEAEWFVRKATDGTPSCSNVFACFDADSLK